MKKILFNWRTALIKKCANYKIILLHSWWCRNPSQEVNHSHQLGTQLSPQALTNTQLREPVLTKNKLSSWWFLKHTWDFRFLDISEKELSDVQARLAKSAWWYLWWHHDDGWTGEPGHSPHMQTSVQELEWDDCKYQDISIQFLNHPFQCDITDTQKFRKNVATRISVKWTDNRYLPSNAEIYQAKILGRTVK